MLRLDGKKKGKKKKKRKKRGWILERVRKDEGERGENRGGEKKRREQGKRTKETKGGKKRSSNVIGEVLGSRHDKFLVDRLTRMPHLVVGSYLFVS